MTKTDTSVNLSITELLKEIHADPFLHIRKTSTRAACKFCHCFLSLQREDITGFHLKQADGTVEFVVVYHGKSYCRYCHKFQV